MSDVLDVMRSDLEACRPHLPWAPRWTEVEAARRVEIDGSVDLPGERPGARVPRPTNPVLVVQRRVETVEGNVAHACEWFLARADGVIAFVSYVWDEPSESRQIATGLLLAVHDADGDLGIQLGAGVGLVGVERGANDETLVSPFDVAYLFRVMRGEEPGATSGTYGGAALLLRDLVHRLGRALHVLMSDEDLAETSAATSPALDLPSREDTDLLLRGPKGTS